MKEPEGDWIYGAHSVRNALDAAPGRVRRVWFAAGRRSEALSALIADARAMGIRVESVNRRTLDRVAQGPHQGVAAQCHAVAPATEAELERRWPSFERPFVLVLDQIQDPRNLGAIIRTADAVNADGLILPKDRAAGITTAAHKASAGSSEYVPIAQVTNLARTIETLKDAGIWVIGADQTAPTSYTQADLTAPTCLVLGNESEGLRRLVKEKCDVLIHLPMFGHVPALNVSVAAGILLYEVIRQRGNTDSVSERVKTG